jgi:hypothetical protein
LKVSNPYVSLSFLMGNTFIPLLLNPVTTQP